MHIAVFGHATVRFFLCIFPELIRGDAQVLYLISTYRVLPDPCFAVMNASILYIAVRASASLSNSFLCSDPSCGCGQGLYPTIIILFVVLQKTPTFVITSERASVHFSDVPSSVEVRIPMSEIYSQPEGTHTDSEMTVLHSPSLYARSKP